MTRRGPDPHADRREHKQRKRRYGMQVTGRSIKLLAALAAKPPKQKPRTKKR
ncbi:MAG TPA: hypothetical protein VGK88_05670 [bacterium]|jgi:hypothetical protein